MEYRNALRFTKIQHMHSIQHLNSKSNRSLGHLSFTTISPPTIFYIFIIVNFNEHIFEF